MGVDIKPMATERKPISNKVKMGSIIIILLLGRMCFAGTYGNPLKTTEASLPNPKYDISVTSDAPLMEVQRSTETNGMGSKVLPINKDIHEKVLANLGNNSIVTESSFVKLLKEIFYPETNTTEEIPSTTNNSNVHKTRFFEILKEIFPIDTFTEDSPGNLTSTPRENEEYDYEDDEVEDVTYPEGLGPRLSATLLKILTF